MRLFKSSAQDWYKQRWHRWLDKRIPASARQQMSLNSIFILPTGFGWAFIIMAISLFLLGTNYQNNLMLLLCYLLLSIMLLALFYTHQNFSYLALKALTVDPFHCHQTGQLVLQVTPHRQHKNKYVNGQLLVSWLTLPRTHPVVVELNHKTTTFLLDNTGSQTLCIPLSYETRGLHRLPRVTLACDFPLGLFKCWTHLDFDSKVLVYPQPIEGEVNYALAENDEEDSATSLQFSNASDFYALTDYHIGQPLNRVAWKQVAKNGNWAVKQFASPQSDITTLSVNDTIDIERAISVLTYHILLLSEENAVFGLKFRSIDIAPSSGKEHSKACLHALACLESSPSSSPSPSPKVSHYSAFNIQRDAVNKKQRS